MAPDVTPLPQAAEVSCPKLLGGAGGAAGWEQARRALGEFFEDVRGSHAIGQQDRRVIYHVIRHVRPRSVLEIGTNVGASTASIALAMQTYRHAAGAPRLVTLDRWNVNDPATFEWSRYRCSTAPRDVLERLKCADSVEFIVSLSTDYLRGRARHGAQFDFIFMDHAPSADIAYQDITLALRALRAGGHLLIHPCVAGGKPLAKGGRSEPVNPGFSLAVGRLQREGAGLVAVPIGALKWPDGRESPRSDLAFLARA